MRYKIALNSPTVYAVMSTLTKTASYAIVIPVAYTKLPSPEFALWQIFVSINILIQLLDFGLSPTFIRVLSYTRGDGDLERNQVQILEQQMNIAKIMGFTGCLLGILLGALLLQELIGATQSPSISSICLFLYCISSLVQFMSNTMGASLQGLGHIMPFKKWEAVISFGQFCTLALAVFYANSLITIVLAQQIWVVISFVKYRSIALRLEPELFLHRATEWWLFVKPDVNFSNLIWKPVFKTGIAIILSQGFVQLSSVILASKLSAESLAVYLLVLRISTFINMLSQIPFNVYIPVFAKLYAQGKFIELYRTLKVKINYSMQFYIGISVLIIKIVYFKLVHHEIVLTLYDNRIILSVFIAAFFAERIGAYTIQIQSLSNNIKMHLVNGASFIGMLICFHYISSQNLMLAFPLAALLSNVLIYIPFCVYLWRVQFKDIVPFQTLLRIFSGTFITVCLIGVLSVIWRCT